MSAPCLCTKGAAEEAPGQADEGDGLSSSSASRLLAICVDGNDLPLDGLGQVLQEPAHLLQLADVLVFVFVSVAPLPLSQLVEDAEPPLQYSGDLPRELAELLGSP